MKKEFKNNTKIVKAQEGAMLPAQEPQIENVQEEMYEENSGEMSCEEIISLLRMSITQAHVWHHATNSYAQHGAFSDYYTAMPELLDVFAEEYQGRFGLIRLTEAFDFLAYNKQTVLDYFAHLATISETHAETLPGHLKNRIEEIIGFIYQTIYKLRELS